MNQHFIQDYIGSKNIIADHPVASEKNPIFAVDDDIDFHTIIKSCYDRAGCKNELAFFESGKELLAYMKEASLGQKIMPALILIDINMPGINGLEVLKEIKSFEEFEHIPVIFMLSNSEAPQDIQRAKDFNANGYLVKSGSIRTYIDFFKNL